MHTDFGASFSPWNLQQWETPSPEFNFMILRSAPIEQLDIPRLLLRNSLLGLRVWSLGFRAYCVYLVPSLKVC